MSIFTSTRIKIGDLVDTLLIDDTSTLLIDDAGYALATLSEYQGTPWTPRIIPT